jgi:hypothetical protein
MVAVVGTVTLGMFVALTFVMEVLSFDSPLRKTSSDLVFGLLVGGAAGLFAAVWSFAAALALRDRPAMRPLVVLSVSSGLLGGSAYAVSVGLAFSFR